MRSFILTFTFLIISFSSLAQNKTSKDLNTESSYQNASEIKLNTFNLIGFKSLDVSYEYILNPESSIGVSALFNLRAKDSNEGIYYREKFALSPYYRMFFSKSKNAYGFFMEFFGMYNVQADYNYFLEEDGYSDDTSNNLAFGFALGGKFLTNQGFVFEFFGGIGRNLIVSDEEIGTDIVPRLGLSAGYRF